ncbi:MAG: ribosomal RNA small subunit methyltransferase A [Fimbriimonadaceae bacterium]|nr:ribosomal RNA small subunit methyltransferase A [Chitinophagales bacterium]
MRKFTHIKSFGQHFLKSHETAKRIVDALPVEEAEDILEIGPGLGILSKHLLQLNKNIYFSEIDKRIIEFLKNDLKVDDKKIIEGDFLRIDLKRYFQNKFLVIGNFPYNISSQILFKVLEYKEQIPALVGMFQKEMAQRVAAKHGNKDYGVITVLIQVHYDVEYLFELSPEEFDLPPKVYSAVIRLKRKSRNLNFDEALFKQIVKTGFNQRRKKLSNALASIHNTKEILIHLNFADKRAEQLSIEDFILLTQKLQN